jgi:hypothetical protein
MLVKQRGGVMPFAANVPSGNKVRISFETNVEIARCLRDLVKFYKMPIAQIMEALICFEHESIKLKDDLPNDFVQEPRKVKW